MKRMIFCSAICLLTCMVASSQARMTPGITARITGKTDFTEIKSEIGKHFRVQRAALTDQDSIRKRFIDRQAKFWNRSLYESESRLDPDGTVAPWTKRMLQAINTLPKNQGDLRAANSSWSLVGPVSVDAEDGIGRVNRMGFHPTNSQIIFAGAARGGLWKSTDAGAQWSVVSGYLPFLGISGIEVKASDPNTIYVLTGDGDAWLRPGYSARHGYVSYSNGVVKTTDGGETWHATADFYSGVSDLRYVGFQLRQDPNNDNTLAVASSAGIFKTANGGNSWTRAFFEDVDGNLFSTATHDFIAVDIEYKPGSSSTLYAAVEIVDHVSDDSRFAFFRSVNSGVLFTEIDLSEEIDTDTLFRFEVGVTPDEPNSVFLACGPGFLLDGDGSNDTFLGFLKSTNSGATFTLRTEEPDIWGYSPTFGPTFGNQCSYDMALAVSPTNADIIFTGGLVVFRSTDGGFEFDGNTTYWTSEVGESIHPDIHDLKFNPLDGKLYAATDGGVYVTPNAGASWDPIFNGLAITQFYHMEPDNENNRLWGGTQDNGVLEQEAGTLFYEFAGGDGYDLMTDNLVGNGNDSYWTTNGGAFTTGNFGTIDITPPDEFTMIGTPRDFGILDMHPSNEDYIYIGYSDAIWYSADRGDSWNDGNFPNTLASGALSVYIPSEGGYISIPVSGDWTVQSCQSNTNRLYSAGNGQMFRIDDIDFEENVTGEATWLSGALIDAGFPAMTDTPVIRKITDICVHPASSSNVWVTASGFSAGKKVFHSDNAGSTWTNISFNLPNVPANCLLRDGDGTLYVGMDLGVFYLPPGEENWIPYFNGLPRIPVTEMHFVTELSGQVLNHYIYAGTYGRGIWRSLKFTGCDNDIPVNGILKGDRFYQANNSITSSAFVTGGLGTDIYFQSGNAITLTTGFQSSENIIFTGVIRPCNTGPYNGLAQGFPDMDRHIRQMYQKPVVIESVKVLPDRLEIKVFVKEHYDFSIELTLAVETDQVEVGARHSILQSAYVPGKYTLSLPTKDIPSGMHTVILLGEHGVIHWQELIKP